MKHKTITVPTFLLTLGLFVGATATAQPPGNNPGRGIPRAGFEPFETGSGPLQGVIREALVRRGATPEEEEQCRAAMADRNPQAIRARCKLKNVRMRQLDASECAGCGEIRGPDNRLLGRRMRAETVLEFASPGERGRQGDRWDDLLFGPQAMGGMRRGLGTLSPQSTVASAVFFPDAAVNEDRDCQDRQTGEHLGGPGVADGAPDSCFDAAGELKITLEEVAGGCRHTVSGTVFAGAANGEDDFCYDAENHLKTTLVELVDEDGEDDDGDGVVDSTAFDPDGDGRFDEDPPADPAASCAAFGREVGYPDPDGLMGADGQCDLTRAFVYRVNEDERARGNGPFFKADEDGASDPKAMGRGEFGRGDREVTLVEDFSIRCENGMELDEASGQCVGGTPAAGARSAVKSEPILGGPCRPGDGDYDLICQAMMGFTFAPPVIEWGYEIEERECFLGICVEVFFARVGYEFGVAVGLRLPIELGISGLPGAAGVRAGQDLALTTTVRPLDFSARQYRDFCAAHQLENDPFIADCDRFGFPNWLERLDPFGSDDDDGDEWVARADVEAGVQVRILMVPVIRWGVFSHPDLAAMCSVLLMSQLSTEDAVNLLGEFILGTAGGEDLREQLKSLVPNCGTFTTPFGSEPDPVSGVPVQRPWPFTASLDVRADCADAILNKEVVIVDGVPFPVCTGLVLGYGGASLGIGLGVEATVGSNLITADLEVSGDADARDGGEVRWTRSEGEDGAEIEVGPVTFDNFDGADFADHGFMTLKDFTYYLNTLAIRLTAQLQFGGILQPIPDLPSVTLYQFRLDVGDLGIPIPQHNGTQDLRIPIFVENYGLKLDLRALDSDDGDVLDAKTLEIKPGTEGRFEVAVRNRGSVGGDFDNFAAELSNRLDHARLFQTDPRTAFFIDPNTDFDCEDAAGNPLRGDPTDTAADDCYGADGLPLAGRRQRVDEDPARPQDLGLLLAERDQDGDGLADEDPADEWAAAFDAGTVTRVAPYRVSGLSSSGDGRSVVFGITPFRHPLTRPGRYPFRITGDSVEAKRFAMASEDPSGHLRTGASDVAFFEVTAFSEPQVAAQPATASGKPGVAIEYTVEGSNLGNVPDSLQLDATLVDFNRAGCTLTTLGTLADCPYRAVPTAIPAGWTTLDALPDGFGPLEPLGVETSPLSIAVPGDWAGMEDTVYQLVLSVTSLEDEDVPPASRSAVLERTVIATKQSMTRYVGLEIRELIAEIEAANAGGVRTGGLLPISMYPAQKANDRALASILAGDLDQASNGLRAEIHLLEAFLRALDGAASRLPADLVADWRARGEAILGDLALAAASDVTS